MNVGIIDRGEAPEKGEVVHDCYERPKKDCAKTSNDADDDRYQRENEKINVPNRCGGDC